MNSRQIIIDTDPGVDDSIAIATACRAKLPIKAIAAVFGNASIENTTRNACTILQIMDSDTPVYAGAALPLSGSLLFPKSHGRNGLGGFRLSQLRKKPEKASAIEMYIHALSTAPSGLTIVCLGPTTNIALLSRLRPDLIGRAAELVILGGVFGERGNMSPVAEFNALSDPLALAHTLALPCKKTLIPIDVCRKVLFTREDFQKIQNPLLQKTFLKIAEVFISYYTSADEYAGFSGAVMYDLLPILYLLDRELFMFEEADVAVETSSPLTRGQTVKLSTRKNPCRIARSIDAQKAAALFHTVINGV